MLRPYLKGGDCTFPNGPLLFVCVCSVSFVLVFGMEVEFRRGGPEEGRSLQPDSMSWRRKMTRSLPDVAAVDFK